MKYRFNGAQSENLITLKLKLKLNFCLQGYQSTGPGIPTKDPTPDYKLIKASEENGYTNIQFERIDTTEGDDKDVQFTVRGAYILLIKIKSRIV